MPVNTYGGLSTDTTLGGSNSSDVVIPSQKAIKTYVDNHSGGGGSVDIDGKSITKNSSDELQTIGVIDQRNTANAIKTWTGTKAQYDAISTKDANTIYNITDDTNPTQALLEALYPVGSIYITTAASCPLSTLISGSTWVEEISRVLVDKGVNGSDWWELYSDGWCRQGGILSASPTVTVLFSKPYIDTNYTFFVNPEGKNSQNGAIYWNTENKTSSQIDSQLVANSNVNIGTSRAWQAEGYTSTTTTHKRFRRTA